MRQSKFTETQIVSILKEADAGRPVIRSGGTTASAPPPTISGKPSMEVLEWPNNSQRLSTPLSWKPPTHSSADGSPALLTDSSSSVYALQQISQARTFGMLNA